MLADQAPVGDWFTRFPAAKVDELLRQAGYRIVARPKYGPALWAKGRQKPVTQETALRQIRKQSS